MFAVKYVIIIKGVNKAPSGVISSIVISNSQPAQIVFQRGNTKNLKNKEMRHNGEENINTAIRQ